ncbi:hypothetical protein CROQUDRAFT_132265 [Cronartium quercuum f. sp. fusiforme G11]|uniref:Uncharacterized protein n=1 Tax=Cronartium quercuum f. sp. fusiforme G11 TaxID=708437 RepID=A0A9P6NIW0_9BASI|nr:hypothetical protein CROQUDRAFT_132265 [Cronartium quercuum f. sp. fusiforme G11]
MSSGISYHEQLSRQDRTFGQGANNLNAPKSKIWGPRPVRNNLDQLASLLFVGRPTTPMASTSPSTTTRRQQDARDSLEDGVPQRRYQTSTCPSTHSLSPLAPEQSSRALLSKFLSRPDDDTQPSPWRGEIGRRHSTNYSITHLSPENPNFTSAETSSRQLSFEPTHAVGLRIDSPRLSSLSARSEPKPTQYHFQPESLHKMVPDGPSGREPQEPSLETQAFVKDQFRSSRQDSIPSTSKNPRPSFSSNRFDGDEFRYLLSCVKNGRS